MEPGIGRLRVVSMEITPMGWGAEVRQPGWKAVWAYITQIPLRIIMALPWCRRRQPALSPLLIISYVEFQQALSLAEEPERSWLARGMASQEVIDQMGAAIAARLVLAGKMMTPEEHLRYVQHLQNRYSVAVGPSTYARYERQIPHDAYTAPAKLWAELQTLSYRLRLAYAVTHIRDHYLAQVRGWCFTGIVVAVVVTVAILSFRGHVLDYPLNYLLVGVLGFSGALTSIARRSGQILSGSPLEDDPIMEASALQQGRASLLIAAATGPIFALLVVIIFWGGKLDMAGLTPKFLDVCPKTPTDAYNCLPDFELFRFKTWLASGADVAKLGLLAFISGFAEQFVPDVLDQFTKTPPKKR